MSGTVAEVNVDGRVGLGAHDYDLKLSVTPHLTSSIPVIAAIAGGPIIGAVIFAADKALSSGLKHVNMYVYKVTGSWLNPDINKI